MGIQVRGDQMEAAREDVVAVTRRFLSLADDLAIPEESITTTGITVRPEYRWNDVARRQELIGYMVSRQLDVRLEDLEKLGELVEGAADAGVNQISPPMLASGRMRELRREALAAAAADAEANARALVDTLGASLGPVREIVDSVAMQPEPMRARAMAMEAQADLSAADTYSAGEIRVDTSVRVTFDLE